MDEDAYQRQLECLRRDWGGVTVDPERLGTLRATNDPMTGILIGMRAQLFAEIINRALAVSPPVEPRPPFIAWEGTSFPDGAIVEIRERDGHEHPMKVGSIQFKNALRELGPRMPVRAATDEQRKGWEPRS